MPLTSPGVLEDPGLPRPSSSHVLLDVVVHDLLVATRWVGVKPVRPLLTCTSGDPFANNCLERRQVCSVVLPHTPARCVVPSNLLLLPVLAGEPPAVCVGKGTPCCLCWQGNPLLPVLVSHHCHVMREKY